MSLLSTSPADAPDPAGGTDEVPDRIVRVCSKCARRLSVGERMFYFLEAVNTPALCRICVLDQERELIAPLSTSTEPTAPPASEDSAPPTPRQPHGAPPPPSRLPLPTYAGPGMSSFRESPADLRSNGSLPSGARQLRLAASHYVDEGRLDEAIECIRELALEFGPSRTGPVPTTFAPSSTEASRREEARDAYGSDPSELGAEASLPFLPAHERSGSPPTAPVRSEDPTSPSDGSDPV